MTTLLKAIIILTLICFSLTLFSSSILANHHPKCGYFYSINPSGQQKLICIIHNRCYWIYDNPYASFYIYPLECEV